MHNFEVVTISTSRQVWTVDDPDMAELILGETSVDMRMTLLRRHGVPTQRKSASKYVNNVELSDRGQRSA